MAVGGIISSAVGAPVGAAAEQEQMPVFLVKSGTPAATPSRQPIHLPNLFAVRANGRCAGAPIRTGTGVHQGRSHRG